MLKYRNIAIIIVIIKKTINHIKTLERKLFFSFSKFPSRLFLLESSEVKSRKKLKSEGFSAGSLWSKCEFTFPEILGRTSEGMGCSAELSGKIAFFKAVAFGAQKNKKIIKIKNNFKQIFIVFFILIAYPA